MDKLCVFCGNRPESKTNEHVLPLWLIELTGEAHRQVFLGYKKAPGMPKREFSFNSFKFPSCEGCNSRFSNLEAKTRPIMLSLLNQRPVSQSDLTTLLDWFDKVRVGLWLAFYYLDANFAAITPKYYIDQRIGLHDRMIAIVQTDPGELRLNFGGCDSPSFYFTPSCFTLVVNHLYFLNISFPFLFSRRIGLPYPLSSFLVDDQPNPVFQMVSGRERPMLPLLRKAFRLRCSQLYQPMFKNLPPGNRIVDFYDTPYVRDRCIDWDAGIGRVFQSDNTYLRAYPVDESIDWLPAHTYPLQIVKREFPFFPFEWQAELEKLQASTRNLSRENQAQIKKQAEICRSYTRMILRQLTKQSN